MRILVIEDVALHAKVISMILKEYKHAEVVKAVDVFEGYAQLHSDPSFDAIILDNKLPFADGTTFLEKVRSMPELKKLPIIISSADKDVDFVKLGATATLEKPYYPNALLSLLEFYISDFKE